MSIPIVKRFLGENFCPVKNGPQNGANFGKWGLNVRFYDRDPEKAYPCAKPRVLAYFSSKSIKGLGCSELQEQKKTKNGKKTSRVNTFGAQSHACAETKPLGGS